MVEEKTQNSEDTEESKLDVDETASKPKEGYFG